MGYYKAKFKSWSPKPSVMLLRGRVLGRWLGPECAAPWLESGLYLERGSFCSVRTQEKAPHLAMRALGLGLPTSRTTGNNFYCLWVSPPVTLCYSAWTAWGLWIVHLEPRAAILRPTGNSLSSSKNEAKAKGSRVEKGREWDTPDNIIVGPRSCHTDPQTLSFLD